MLNSGMAYSEAQTELQKLFKDKEWSLEQLGKKVGDSKQTVYNRLFINKGIDADTYMHYKRVLSGLDKPTKLSIVDSKEEIHAMLKIVIQLEDDFSRFAEDGTIDLSELQIIKGRRNMLIDKLGKFISKMEANLNMPFKENECR